jgi:hypothetical protein
MAGRTAKKETDGNRKIKKFFHPSLMRVNLRDVDYETGNWQIKVQKVN